MILPHSRSQGIYFVYNFPDWDTLNKQKWGITREEKEREVKEGKIL